MTVEHMVAKCGFDPISLPDPSREICGVYIGDLLSWVMGRASEGNAWITIMSNINVIAVASLTDVSCVILAEGVTLEDDVLVKAEEKQINIIHSSLPAYETALKIRECLI